MSDYAHFSYYYAVNMSLNQVSQMIESKGIWVEVYLQQTIRFKIQSKLGESGLTSN